MPRMTLRSGFSLGGIIKRTINAENAEAFPSLFPKGSDEYWMERALLKSMEGVGEVAPNPSVGCAIVQNGHLLALERTEKFGGRHAERCAFDRISDLTLLQEAEIFITLEPCTHQGKQPPCIDLFEKIRPKKIVIACKDPDSRVLGKGVKRLQELSRQHHFDLILGVLESECAAWHFPFMQHRRQAGKPVFIAKWAEDLNGLLSGENEKQVWITGHEARAYTHWLRQKYDAIVVGRKTFQTDQPKLTVRSCAKPHHRNPLRFVLSQSSQLELPKGFEQVHSFEELKERAVALGLQSILVEGGAEVLQAGFERGLFSAAHQITSPEKKFNLSSPRRVLNSFFESDQSWQCLVESKLGEDRLREWVKLA